jgi:hypothetical protein
LFFLSLFKINYKIISKRTIDMHGAPVGVTWTYLGVTAQAGSNSITLQEPVVWPIGSLIVVATTGDKFSPGQSETVHITSKSSDNRTLYLDQSLQFQHLNEMRTVGSGSKIVNLYIKSEVGLLSRNVLFQGYKDNTWAPLSSSLACPGK